MDVTKDSTVDSNQFDDSSRNHSELGPVAVDSPSSVELASFFETESDVAEESCANEKRLKLNLWKCKQCRDARKKCFLANRVWPQKCDRCLSHGPEPIDCSEPELNTRKRGPNRRLLKISSEERPSSKRLESQRSSSDDDSGFERPAPTPVMKSRKFKRELPSETTNREDWHPASCYQPLGDGEFRILKLAPGESEDSSISCSFVITSMAQPMRYEAISYLWGAPGQKSMSINLVDSDGRAHPIFTRSNLYEALKCLRHPTNTRHFWVDALCINHGSDEINIYDRNKQISMKRSIFHNAKNVCFWIGEDDNYMEAFRFIPRILDLTGVDNLIRDDKAIDGWVSFVALLKNPVFGRLWLVQEVAIGQNVTLHSGVMACHYADLVEAVAIFRSFRDNISLLFRRNGKNYRDLIDRRISMAERFIEVSTNALRMTAIVYEGTSEQRRTQQRLRTLEELVSSLSELTATNPLDRIYSVLAIAKDGPPLTESTLIESAQETKSEFDLHIDYSASVVDVYQRFVVHAIESSRSLDIICRHWVNSASDCNLPTWVRPLECALPLNSNIPDRLNADSLVGLPRHNLYNTSRGTMPTFTISSPKSPESPRSLFVRGLYIDTISHLSPRAEDGIIQYEWLELGQCDITHEKVPEAFWRTLVADRGPNGSFTPSWYSRAFLYCLQHISPTGDIKTNRLIAESEAESSLFVDFLQRVQSVIWTRKFLVSKKRNYIGLAPKPAQVGDLICILFGCTVPVVLRRCEDEKGAVYFQLVGESYVHGIMDGEAVAAGFSEEEFELR
ncbi:Heterokaryon incompatibility protein (HET) domain containing protein [Hyaloscypha variabilis]